MKTYLIKYDVFLYTGILTDKVIRVKRKHNELEATTSLEGYLKRKHGKSFLRLEIISCREDSPSNIFDLFSGIFNPVDF